MRPNIIDEFLKSLLFWSLVLIISVAAVRSTWAVLPFLVWFILAMSRGSYLHWRDNA